MRLDEFDFELPASAIAQRPVEPRDAARLLHVSGGLADHRVSDLPGLLRRGDLMVFNDTKVIPARLRGSRGDASIEVTLHKEEGEGIWAAFARPAKRLKEGDAIAFAPGLRAAVTAKRDAGEVVLDFQTTRNGLFAALEAHGRMPLPPYIKREKTGDDEDREDYQTMFAAREGAVAAPTAGLHFTPALMERLADAGIDHSTLTLHVGAGTFLPVKADDTDGHVMHGEWGEVSSGAARRINEARAAGGRIIGVGTTVVRLLESASDGHGRIHRFDGETDLFITPGYEFKAVDLMLTNFHLPRSTLFMLVSAFAGMERMKGAYAHAVASGYRFYSYGDCCLLEPHS